MNKYEIQVDGENFIVDGISYEFAQLDGDEAGRSDDGLMYRDVVGLTNKVYCDFKDKDKYRGVTLSNLLKLVKKKSCSFNYFDPIEYGRVTKTMYVAADKVTVDLLNDEIVLKDDWQIRFIQMDVDEI